MKPNFNLPFTIYRLPLVTCFLFFFFHASSAYSQGVVINGKVLAKVGPVTVLVKKDNKLIATATVDDASKFQIKIEDLKTTASNIRVDLFITGIGMDTSYAKSIVLIKNSTVNCDLEFPNPHNKNVLGDVTCPKCGKTNMTIPIVYQPFVGIRNNQMGAGTDVESKFSPEWYCKRCNIKF